MDFTITAMPPFSVIGFERELAAAEDIPQYWDEIFETYAAGICVGNPPSDPVEEALVENGVGEFGISVAEGSGGRFRYLIAGHYAGGEVPAGMTVLEIPACDWAVFDCVGPVPETLQRLKARVLTEWLPNEPAYAPALRMVIEWYDSMSGAKTDPAYHSALWLPVKKQEAESPLPR